MKKISKKTVAIVLTIAIFSYLTYIFFVPPSDGGFHIKCLTKTLFNFNCMGCGLTRFVYFAMHGDFQTALQYNVLGPLLLIILAVIYFYFLRWALFDKDFPEVRLWLVWAFLVFAVVYSILRNIPYEPFEFLAPPS